MHELLLPISPFWSGNPVARARVVYSFGRVTFDSLGHFVYRSDYRLRSSLVERIPEYPFCY